MKQWLIVAELPEPLRSELGQLRTELDIWTPRRLPPHVTVVRPFVARFSEEVIAEITRPISIIAQLLKWAIFRHPANNVLYLEPTQTAFQAARRDLITRVPDIMKADRSVDPSRQFAENPTFHVTIAAGVPDDVIDLVYSKVSQKTYTNVFQVHNLSLFSMENQAFWELEG